MSSSIIVLILSSFDTSLAKYLEVVSPSWVRDPNLGSYVLLLEEVSTNTKRTSTAWTLYSTSTVMSDNFAIFTEKEFTNETAVFRSTYDW